MTKDSETEKLKVKVRFKAVGSAPILKKTRYSVERHQKISVLRYFLLKQLGIQDETEAGNLFIYCQSSFSPNPSQLIGDLHDMFKETFSSELVIDYSLTSAYG